MLSLPRTGPLWTTDATKEERGIEEKDFRFWMCDLRLMKGERGKGGDWELENGGIIATHQIGHP
jgi:hypothetical protein